MNPTIDATEEADPAMPQRDHAADQRQRNVRHDDQRQDRRLVARIQHQKDERRARAATATPMSASPAPAPGTCPRAASCSLPEAAFGQRSRRTSATMRVMSRGRRCWRTRRCGAARSRAGSGWARRSSSTVASGRSGTQPCGRIDQRSGRPVVERLHRRSRSTTSKRRLPSTIWAPCGRWSGASSAS